MAVWEDEIDTRLRGYDVSLIAGVWDKANFSGRRRVPIEYRSAQLSLSDIEILFFLLVK